MIDLVISKYFTAQIICKSPVESEELRFGGTIMQAETKTVLQTTDIAAHLKAPAKPLTDIELQQDYDYFMAQETANMLLSAGLISLVEFNKLTQINRDTFSPMLREIMPKIT